MAEIITFLIFVAEMVVIFSVSFYLSSKIFENKNHD